jgi:hypothetical protein
MALRWRQYSPQLTAFQQLARAVQWPFCCNCPSVAATASTLALDVWKTARRFPRVRLATPVVVKVGKLTLMGQSENVSLGGLLLEIAHQLSEGLEVDVLFNLPTGHTVSTRGVVVHTLSSRYYGIKFPELEDPSRTWLALFVQKLITYVRRGARISKRMHVTLRAMESDGSSQELAETVALSRHGGLLVARARFAVGDLLYVWWPGGKRGAYVRIVHRRQNGAAGLAELGFEFTEAKNFWGINFPEERMN